MNAAQRLSPVEKEIRVLKASALAMLSRLQPWFIKLHGNRATSWLRLVIAGVTAAVPLFLLASPVANAAPTGSSYVSSATMRFGGAVNLLGLLSSLTVSPSEVWVSAGGAVTFINDSGVSLELAVAGRNNTLPSGGTQRYTFPGQARAQSLSASVTPSQAPLVGEALTSSGTVQVAAASQDSAPTTPSSLPSPSTTPDSTPDGALSGEGTKSAQDPHTAATHSAQATVVPATPTSRQKWQLGPSHSVDGLLEPRTSSRAARPGADEATAQQGVLPAFVDDGQAGLLIVAAVVLLIGVTSAAMRIVLAQRRARLRG